MCGIPPVFSPPFSSMLFLTIDGLPANQDAICVDRRLVKVGYVMSC